MGKIFITRIISNLKNKKENTINKRETLKRMWEENWTKRRKRLESEVGSWEKRKCYN